MKNNWNSISKDIQEINNNCKKCKGTRSEKGGYKFICSSCKRVYYIGGRDK